jgi:zinc protease
MPARSLRLPRVLCAALALFLAAPVAATPQIQEWTTSGGARVLFVAADALPMVDVELVFDAGSARDGTASGLAQLTNALLGEGAGERDADAIAETFEGLGARFSSGAERDMATVSLRSLTDPALLDPALELFASVVAEPSFPADAIARVRGQMQVALQAEQQSPGDLASKAFYRAVYDDHPYGNPPNGTQESLATLTRDDVLTFFGRYYVQTHVLLGQPGMHRGDPDYFALYLGNHALGGSGLVSRLNEEVREKRGLAYSVYSYFMPMRRDGPFQMALQTRSDQAGEALAILRDNLERYVAEGPTPDELAFSKRNVTGGYPLRIDSNGKLIGYLAMIGFYDLPLDYLERFIERVEAVDHGQVNDALARRLDPGRLVTVTVGPRNPLDG